MRRLLLIILPSVMLLAACGSGSTVDASAGQSGEGDGAAGSSVAGEWIAVASSPLSPRSETTIAWSGSEILVIGGSTFTCPPGAGCAAPEDPPLADGAAYDPQAKTWRKIADAPTPVLSAATALHGTGLYLLASPGYGAAEQVLLRYRPAEDEWSTIELPQPVAYGSVIAAGPHVVVAPSSDEQGQQPDLRYDPETETWDELPPDPLSPSFDRAMVWAAGSLYLFAKPITPSPGGASGPSLVHAARLDGDTWTELPIGETLSFFDPIVDGDRIVSPLLGCADGGRTNNYGRCIPQGAMFDTEAQEWAPLPDPPGGTDHAAAGAVARGEVRLWAAGLPMLDLRTDTWFEVPDLPDAGDPWSSRRNVAGAGPYGFAFGGALFSENEPSGRILDTAWLWSPPAA